MDSKQKQQTARDARRPLQRFVRRTMKNIVTFGWLVGVGTTATEEQLWWLRTTLRSWNRWPKKGWSILPPKPRSLLKNNRSISPVITINVNLMSPRSGSMLPAQECKTKNIAEQGCECWINLWKAITELQQQSKRQKEPLQTTLWAMTFPCSPNDAAQARRADDARHSTGA
jgi:hypothetical protein